MRKALSGCWTSITGICTESDMAFRGLLSLAGWLLTIHRRVIDPAQLDTGCLRIPRSDVSTGFGSQDLSIESSMGLFNRKKGQDSDSADSSDNKKEKGSWKRPASLSLLPSFLFNI